MSRSRLNEVQIAQFEHDEASESKKVKITNGDISIELSAADGDSVILKSDSVLTLITDGQQIDLSLASRVCLYGVAAATLKVVAPEAVVASLILQDLTYTADVAGVGGNSITVRYTTGATAGSEIVSVVTNAITVQIDTGVSTATQVKAAVDASIAASALISVAISGTGSNAQVAVAATPLTGGSATRLITAQALSEKVVTAVCSELTQINFTAPANGVYLAIQ